MPQSQVNHQPYPVYRHHLEQELASLIKPASSRTRWLRAGDQLLFAVAGIRPAYCHPRPSSFFRLAPSCFVDKCLLERLLPDLYPTMKMYSTSPYPPSKRPGNGSAVRGFSPQQPPRRRGDLGSCNHLEVGAGGLHVRAHSRKERQAARNLS